uniref:Uncharacterized protein n=1 Tax=Rhizophora mucronata TaxID=61149 RepID=A0A2P2P9L9_RHIMU
MTLLAISDWDFYLKTQKNFPASNQIGLHKIRFSCGAVLASDGSF